MLSCLCPSTEWLMLTGLMNCEQMVGELSFIRVMSAHTFLGGPSLLGASETVFSCWTGTGCKCLRVRVCMYVHVLYMCVLCVVCVYMCMCVTYVVCCLCCVCVCVFVLCVLSPIDHGDMIVLYMDCFLLSLGILRLGDQFLWVQSSECFQNSYHHGCMHYFF